jgi:hypothetical protein
MGWIRLDDTHQDHPKLVEAGPMAELLDVRAICYSARLELDGRVPSAALVQLGRGIPRVRVHVQRLVKVGRWRVASRRDGGDGWVINGFLDQQPSKAEREAERASARERQRAYRARGNGEVRAKSRRESRRESRSTTQTTRSTPLPPIVTPDGPLTDEQRERGRAEARAAGERLRKPTKES